MTSFGSELLFSTRVNDHNFTGLSVDYEMGQFRYDALVDMMFEALPDFALNHAEKAEFGIGNAVKKMRHAAQSVYQTDKYKTRGEFGELLLHLLICDFFNTVPAISKIYYEDGSNEVVKGFDAVHVVVDEADQLELWLGEVKFYDNIYKAISDVVEELQRHTNRDYLRGEFLFISRKIEDTWPHAADLKKLLDARTSLDKVFKKIRIPVLLTYNSSIVQKFRNESDEYVSFLKEELNRYHGLFRSKAVPENVEILLILLPLEFKAELVKRLHNQLTVWGAI